MGKTIFSTGTSSGIGKATALYFAEQGWNAAATMRSPENQDDFARSPNVKIYRLHVTGTKSIATASSDAIKHFGQKEYHAA